jgi:NAD-dependent deacetylase
MDKIQKLANLIKDAEKITILSGAGISTESGIPDFRSTQGAFWLENKDRVALMSARYRDQNPEKFWPIFKEIFQIKLAQNFSPNYGHLFLKELEDMGKEVHVFTQNVDGLHSEAGSTNVYEVHGTIKKATCYNCGDSYDLDYINSMEVPQCNSNHVRKNVCNEWIAVDADAKEVTCHKCGTKHDLDNVTSVRCKGIWERVSPCTHYLDPDVVLFGDPIKYYNEGSKHSKNCDLFIVLGSSLQVGPINDLPFKASDGRAEMIIINRDPTDYDKLFDLIIHDSIGETFKKVKELL